MTTAAAADDDDNGDDDDEADVLRYIIPQLILYICTKHYTSAVS